MVRLLIHFHLVILEIFLEYLWTFVKPKLFQMKRNNTRTDANITSQSTLPVLVPYYS